MHADSDWAKRPERKSTSGGMVMINRTVVNHWSRTQASRVLSTSGGRVLRGSLRSSRRSGNPVDDGGLGIEFVGLNLDGFQRSRGKRFERRIGQDETNRTKIFVAPSDDHIPSQQNLADYLTKGKTWFEIDELIQGARGRIRVSRSAQGRTPRSSAVSRPSAAVAE